jgi:dephospho-CoA kinase
MRKTGVMEVGLCGRSGSGKGYVSAVFARFGIPSVDTDAVYRALTGPAPEPSPCMRALSERFGPSVLSPDHSLNRAAMRTLVFGEGNGENLADLNAISHRFIREDTRRRTAELFEAGYPVVLVDAPLLYESGFDSFCEAVVCVTAPEDVILRRIMARDGLSREDAAKRLAAQIPAEELEERADFTIVNDGSLQELEARVEAVARELFRIRSERYGEREAGE